MIMSFKTPSSKKFTGKSLIAGIYILVVKAINEVFPDLDKARPWVDKTIQYCVELTCNDGSIKHWFNANGFVSESDFAEKGIYFGQKVPVGFSFMSTEGHSEQYLVNDKTKKRQLQNQSLVNYKGKEQLMPDSKIDSLMESGEEVIMVRESKQRTANRMFCEFAIDCGIPTETDFEFSDIVGLEVGAKVREIEGRTSAKGNAVHEVHYFMEASVATEKIAEEVI